MVRCYTPAPDTPRSIACMQTGMLPYFNGCDTRIKWPKYYVHDEITTIFDHAVSQGMDVNVCVEEHYYNTGFFKYAASGHIREFSDIAQFVAASRQLENALCFVGTPDYHYAMDDIGATSKGISEGHRVIGKLFEDFLIDEFINSFDYMFCFSDHGHSLNTELSNPDKLDLLKDSRTNILMFYRKKDEKELTKDSRLCSITDMYATMESLLGLSDFRDGLPFTLPPERKELHIEDHSDFKVSPEVMIKQWRYISDTEDIRTNVYRTVDENGDNADLEDIDQYLCAHSPRFVDYKKQLGIWKAYTHLKAAQPEYYVGGPRLSGLPLKLAKVEKHLRNWLKIN